MSRVSGEFLFLGTGSSLGVPVIGCHCSVCESEYIHNKRLRSSGLLMVNQKNVLIDCGPDFRLQALNQKINHVDGIILTHPHYDHIGGFDDLRALFVSRKEPIPCLLSNESKKDVLRRFNYMFEEHYDKPMLLPKIALKELKDDNYVLEFLGLKLKVLTYHQIDMPITGIVCGDFAYISDIKRFPDTIFKSLEGVENLVISALRFTESLMHFSVDEAVDFARKVGAKRTFLTHTAHELDYEKTNAYLPSNIQMAYDGLKLTFQAEVVECL